MGSEEWGLLVLDKPTGVTSHRAVQRVRKALGTARAGHAGTLDPLASGVLLVAVGKATRLLEFLVGHDKTYRARIRLGEFRDTLDREGELVRARPVPPLGRTAVETVLEKFLGEIRQVPPVYSAVKVGGTPLHRRVRRGETVEPPPRTVSIHRLKLDAVQLPDLVVTADCSKGTYIRSLARDIGEALGTVACLWELRRLCSGPFTLEGALGLEEMERLGPDAWEYVLPPSCMVRRLPSAVLPHADIQALAQGLPVRHGGVGVQATVAVFEEGGQLAAVASVRDGLLCPHKVFVNAAGG